MIAYVVSLLCVGVESSSVISRAIYWIESVLSALWFLCLIFGALQLGIVVWLCVLCLLLGCVL